MDGQAPGFLQVLGFASDPCCLCIISSIPLASSAYFFEYLFIYLFYISLYIRLHLRELTLLFLSSESGRISEVLVLVSGVARVYKTLSSTI